MGHYDEEYAAEEEKHRKMKRKRDVGTMQRMDDALATINYFVHNEVKKDSELDNAWQLVQGRYALWLLKQDLLVRNPDIIMDILKDDK